MSFVTPTKFKKARFLEFGLKSQFGNPDSTAPEVFLNYRAQVITER
jgi:hypothetical protein